MQRKKMSGDPKTPGRSEALNLAIERYGNYFFRYFLRRVGAQHLAEDLYQEFWVSVFKGVEPERMLHFGLLRNRAKEVFIAHTRRAQTRAFVSFMDDVPEKVANPEYESGTEAGEMAIQERFWALVPGVNLTLQQKTVFWMNQRIGYSQEAISAKLSIPESTVGDWIRLAKAECRRCVNKES